ncbi:MotE family protein [Azorhizobium oxalatiphilum]|nr:MotE family protein [Azorhizobium oxalatiphilum]
MSLWPLIAVYAVGIASGALLAGAIAWVRICDLKHEIALLRAGIAGAMRAPALSPSAARVFGTLSCAVLALIALAPKTFAQQAAPAPAAVQAADPRDDNALAYCRNIANVAADARFARQAAALAAMEKELEQRIAQLEAKRAEYQDWLQRRENFLKKADESLIAVISQMRPDAAAAQISVMADEAAAAVLAKLNPRSASAILNEMEPARAASLTNTMVGISRRAQAEGRS